MKRRLPPDAFEHYVGLGPGRSYRVVAEKYGVTKRAVVKRAAKERWSQQLAEIEAKAREKSTLRLVDELADMRVRHFKTVRAMHARAVKGLQEFPLTSCMDAMRAAEMAIKLERLLAGEASERTETTVEEVTKRELTRWLVPVDGPGV